MTTVLRIVRVLPFFGDAFGGPVAQARRVHRELAARGHEVHLISSDLGLPPEVPRDAWHRDGGANCFFARAHGWATRPPYCPPAAAVRVLRETIADGDVATVNCGLSRWGTALSAAARAARVPFVYNAEGALDPVRLRQKWLQKRLFLACCERPVLRRAAAAVAVTEHEATSLAQQGVHRERIHVIPNGVELPPLADANRRRRGRERLGLPDDAVVALFFGRMHPLKGLDLLLAAAAPLLREDTRRHLAIVGPDEGAGPATHRQVDELGLQSQVHFHATVGEQARPEVLAAADLFVLTSRSEGLPNAALEAAAAGLPLLVSDACHLPEVEHFGAGAVCGADVHSVRDALAGLLADAQLRRRCGEGAQRMVAERFELGQVVDRLERLYSDLAAAARR